MHVVKSLIYLHYFIISLFHLFVCLSCVALKDPEIRVSTDAQGKALFVVNLLF